MNLMFYQKVINKFQNTSEGKIIFYRSISIFLLFVLTVYMVYVAPIGIDKLYCAILLIIFWYSKADYFWFAFIFIITAYPGGFFMDTTADAVRRLPIYSPISKISFTVMDLFLIIALVKAIIKGKRFKFRDVLKLKSVTYIFPFILVVSLFYGITLKMFLNSAVRGLFFYTLIYSFPSLINNKRDVYKFMVMFFPFVFLELFSQIFTINTGFVLYNLLITGSSTIGISNSITGDIRVLPNGYISMRLAYVFAFVLLDNKDKVVPKIYSLLVIMAVISSVVISATRSAIVMMIFIFIMYFIFVIRKKPNVFLQIFIMGVAIIFILDLVQVFNLNDVFGSTYKRFTGAVSVEEGSIRAEDTFDHRINVRLPLLIDAINKSLFVGYGFSDKYYENFDGHLGGVLIGILQAGVFGYILYLIFIFNIFKTCFIYIKKLPKNNPYIDIIKVFLISFFGYFIVNFSVDPVFVLNTSTQPQDIFIHFIITSLFIYFALREQAIKRIEERNKTMKIA